MVAPERVEAACVVAGIHSRMRTVTQLRSVPVNMALWTHHWRHQLSWPPTLALFADSLCHNGASMRV